MASSVSEQSSSLGRILMNADALEITEGERDLGADVAFIGRLSVPADGRLWISIHSEALKIHVAKPKRARSEAAGCSFRVPTARRGQIDLGSSPSEPKDISHSGLGLEMARLGRLAYPLQSFLRILVDCQA